MRLLCCVVTHNRLDYTRRTIETLREGADWVVVIDNASSDGTQEWLVEHAAPGGLVDGIVCGERNVFPGAACNIGWHEGLKRIDADLLMRSDNDIEYLFFPGWRRAVEDGFRWEQLGQLGLLNMHEDFNDQQPVIEEHGVNVHFPRTGGNCVIRRDLWEHGFRWEAGPWQPGGNDEDTKASFQIERMGYRVARVIPTVANNMSFHRYQDFPEYYDQTAALRGLVPQLSV